MRKKRHIINSLLYYYICCNDTSHTVSAKELRMGMGPKGTMLHLANCAVVIEIYKKKRKKKEKKTLKIQFLLATHSPRLLSSALLHDKSLGPLGVILGFKCTLQAVNYPDLRMGFLSVQLF